MAAHESVILSQYLNLATLKPEQLKLFNGVKEEFQEVPLAIIVITMAIIPAIAEEFFLPRFRHVVFSSLCGLATSRLLGHALWILSRAHGWHDGTRTIFPNRHSRLWRWGGSLGERIHFGQGFSCMPCTMG